MSNNSLRRKVEKTLKSDGWSRVRWNCVHEIFQHAEKPGSIPVPRNLQDRNLALDILRKQAGIKDVRL